MAERSAFESLLRLWFTFDDRVGRRTYARHGAAFMVLKYALDASAVWIVRHELWTPGDYLSPLVADQAPAIVAGSPWLGLAMALWTLPFLWVGITMTMRRLVDAGHSVWWSLLFFVPFLNYALMIILSLLPSDPNTVWWPEEEFPVVDTRLRTALAGVAAGAGLVLVMVWLCTMVFRAYGASLFLGTPVVLGITTAFIHNHGHPQSARSTFNVVTLALLLAAGALLLFAMEGLACIVMAAPLALVLAAFGGILGRAIALRVVGGTGKVALVALALPVLAVVEGQRTTPPLREVVTVIEIAAPADVVWRQVTSFAKLEEPREALFRTGVAYPVRATIDGTGAGAIRRCEFSTGAFVEPITVWDEPRRLAFDVAEQPPPLREWSPYAAINPLHLDGFFRSRRGEFRLTPLPGERTRLEGSTWYEVEIYPQFYWRIFADAIVGAIHTRVLEAIKSRAEAGGTTVGAKAGPTQPVIAGMVAR